MKGIRMDINNMSGAEQIQHWLDILDGKNSETE